MYASNAQFKRAYAVVRAYERAGLLKKSDEPFDRMGIVLTGEYIISETTEEEREVVMAAYPAPSKARAKR